jgi:hypothetical protein
MPIYKRNRLNALKVKKTNPALSERISAEAPPTAAKPASLPTDSEFEPDTETGPH